MFSIVIPTHNRLALLRDAIDSVLGQDYSDWELVVFDNASQDDIAGHIRQIGDPRIRYERSDAFLPVTDSWNRAVDLARGEYITLLGDDDGLVPGYFEKVRSVCEEFHFPDVIYSAIYQFLHPGVAPWERRGYVAYVKNGFFFVGKDAPFQLSKDDALKAVRGSLDFKRNFTFNMQAFCFKRSFLESLRKDGPVFRSPFPDYYLANVALLRAKEVIVVPDALAIAGVSKASFGYTLFNGLEEQGTALLNTELTSDPHYEAVERLLLPGPRYDLNYALTMEHVFRNASDVVADGVNWRRYRSLQMFRMLNSHNGRRGRNTPQGMSLWSRLGLLEKIWMLGCGTAIKLGGRIPRFGESIRQAIWNRVSPYSYVPPENIVARGKYERLTQFFADLKKKSPGARDTGEPAHNSKEITKASPSLGPRLKAFSTAVVYLARVSEELASVTEFVQSYRRNEAGTEHDLVVVFKGADDRAKLDAMKGEFQGIPYRELQLSDAGYDINAYLTAAGVFDYDNFVFLNTFSQIAAPGWLDALVRNGSANDVGIAGAMGSYESLWDSYALMHKVIWLCNNVRISFDPLIAKYYDFIVQLHCAEWSRSSHSQAKQQKGALHDLMDAIRRYRHTGSFSLQEYSERNRSHLDHEFKRMWEYQISPAGAWPQYSRFPRFPNPHIRSNGFFISRRRLMTISPGTISDKYDACAFESGSHSITSQLTRGNFKAVVVGRDGIGYDIGEWTESRTFRLGRQENLLISDNQSRAFEKMSQGSKSTHVRMTWGDYLGFAPRDYPDLGFQFAVDPTIVPVSVRSPRSISEPAVGMAAQR